jgi:hypothetical protein
MDKNEQYIKEIFKYVTTESILIIDKNGKLARLYCPFEVVVIGLLPDLKIGDIVWVEAVKMTVTLKDVYIIRSKAYYVWNFRIFS